MNKEERFLEKLSKEDRNMKYISIYVDKIKKIEYLTFNSYEIRYKLKTDELYLTYPKEEVLEMKMLGKNAINEILNDENNIYYEYEDKRRIHSYKAGTFLCDFLNCDFREFNSLKKFIDKYSLAFLTKCLKENEINLELKALYTKEEYNNLIKEIAEKHGDIFEVIKSRFIYDVDNVYNVYNEESKKDLTPYEIYIIAMNSNKRSRTFDLFDTSKIYIEFDEEMTEFENVIASKEKYVVESVREEREKIVPLPYIFGSLDVKQILYIEFRELMCIDKFPIRKCQNCEKYFVPDKRTDELYCNNVFDETGKTCKEAGFFAFKQRQLKQDDVARLFRNTYQQKLLRAKRNPNNKSYAVDLDNFRKRYKEVKEKIAKGQMSKEEFKEWLIMMKK